MNAAERTRQALDRAMAGALRNDDYAFEPVQVDRLVLSDNGAGLEDAHPASVDAGALADDDCAEGGA